MNHQMLRFISLDFLSSIKIQFKDTNYDADNIDNNKSKGINIIYSH